MKGEIELNPLHKDAEIEPDPEDEAVVVEAAIEAAIEASGFGKYQKIVCFISGLLWAADSMEVSLLSFLYECAGASLNLTSAEAATIVSVVFVGELFGAGLAGPLADAYGRRPVSIGTAGLVAFFGLLTAAAPNLWILLLCRFAVGIAVGGLAVPFDLVLEYLPASARGTQLTAIEFAWAFGAIYATGAAWLTLRHHSWRLLVLVCGFPFVFVFFAIVFFVDESPRWLAQAGKLDRLAYVLSRVDTMNHPKTPGQRHLESQKQVAAALKKASSSSNTVNRRRQEDDTILSTTTTTTTQQQHHAQKSGLEAFRDIPSLLTRKDLRSTTLKLWIVWLGFGLVFYGISLLATRIFNESDSEEFICDFNYAFVLGISTSQIFGVLVLLFLIDRLGRRASQAWPYALTAIALLPVPILHQRHYKYFVFSCLYIALGAIMCASSASWVHVAELYPTDVRATGHSIVLTVSRLSAFSTSYLVDSTLPISTICAVLAVVALLASLASASLPETHHQHYDTSSSPHQPPLTIGNNYSHTVIEASSDTLVEAKHEKIPAPSSHQPLQPHNSLETSNNQSFMQTPYHSLEPNSPTETHRTVLPLTTDNTSKPSREEAQLSPPEGTTPHVLDNVLIIDRPDQDDEQHTALSSFSS